MRSRGHRRPSFRFALVLLAVAPAVVGCQRRSSSTRTTAASVGETAGAKRAASLADADIADAIRRYMREDGVLRSEHVAAAVTDGVATLSGSTSDLLAHERAVALVETIKGVRSVVDEVTVAPLPRTDAQIKGDVLGQLERDRATRPYTIDVTVKDATVTLSGTADSWQQKRMFGDVAKTAKGVRAVDNQIAVRFAARRPQAEIANDVKDRIANDVWLDSDVLGVTVTGQTVHLRGVVGSVAQRERAKTDAWVAGVGAVDDAAVDVDWLAHDQQRSVTDYTLRSDAEIADGLREALRLDPRLAKLVPKVAVAGGIVTLTGMVDDAKARRAAERDARDTLGVWQVHDEVTVEPGGKPTDADIERAIKRTLAKDLLLPDAHAVAVSSAKGKVVLGGTVGSDFERFDAREDAQSVPGVHEVENDLAVVRPQAQTKTRIEDQLFWDPRVERDRVGVALDADGVATLTGTLDAWSEIKAAGDDALRAGATKVVNLLALKHHPEVAAPPSK